MRRKSRKEKNQKSTLFDRFAVAIGAGVFAFIIGIGIASLSGALFDSFTYKIMGGFSLIMAVIGFFNDELATSILEKLLDSDNI